MNKRALSTGIWLVSVVAGILLAVAVIGVSQQKAPANPEFTAYLQAVQQGRWPLLQTPEGYYLGFIPPPVDLSHTAGQQITGGRLLYAPSFDLRTAIPARLTAIRDQGNCGSCWAFAAAGSLESWLLSSLAGTWDFSENNLNRCHGFFFPPCGGGNNWMSAAYFARADADVGFPGGPVSEADDLYDDTDPGPGCAGQKLLQKYVRDVHMIPDRGGPWDNDNLKQAIMDYGAVATFMFVNGGSFNFTHNTYYYDGPDIPGAGHLVCLVGWNDNFDRSKFNPSGNPLAVPPGNGAWIARNSWGTLFGEAGYFYISYYDAWIGTDNAAFVNAVEPLTGLTLYQYDPLGWVQNYGWNVPGGTDYGANSFTPVADGQVISVSTYATDVNTAYKIYIKGDIDYLNGTPVASGTFTYPGYHTVDLATPYPVTVGNPFVVVVALTCPNYGYPIPVESALGGYSDAATAPAGVSYLSDTGESGSWWDTTTIDSTMNCCIKAITGTAGAPAAPAAPSSLTATAVSSSRIDLDWLDNASNESGFAIERKISGGTFVQVGLVGAGVTTYSSSVNSSTTYCFRVRAYNAGGSSTYSNEACATTPAACPTCGGGDVDGDGVIEVVDLRLCLQIAQGILTGTPEQRAAADLDGDGDVDMDDAVILAEYLIGIRPALPRG